MCILAACRAQTYAIVFVGASARRFCLIDLSPPDRSSPSARGSSDKTTPYGRYTVGSISTYVHVFSWPRRMVFVSIRFFFLLPARTGLLRAWESRLRRRLPLRHRHPKFLTVRFLFSRPGRGFFFLFSRKPRCQATTRSSLILTIQWDQKRESVINSRLYIYM
ncbi:unnamed protein product [Aphis gossypii]|uniref:Uncharacterized protein n=1 Tax=Aphis gossypii TaxID=80765 RepID=A0A9P0NG67_APHGO|nr:unnamed protein product [Aphis gossypii]